MRCPYCEQKVILVTGDTIYPRRPDLHDHLFWFCRPCDAYVGCHKSGKGTTPFGTLANAELRAARMAAHNAFDPLWRSGHMKRSEAYRWLAPHLGLPPKHCHISWLTLDQCQKVVSVCTEYFQAMRRAEMRAAETLRQFEHAISE